MIAGIRMQRNLDRRIVSRQSYGILDVLSDIGGMQSILIGTFAIILSIINFADFDSNLASKLYLLKDEEK